MARRSTAPPCAVCSHSTNNPCELPTVRLSRVVIEGHTLAFCREHAALIASSMPRTFEELRALFLEPDSRRSILERRGAQDRRVFPPRPEGRRMPRGRRAGDALQ